MSIFQPAHTHDGVWKKGNKTLTGTWYYVWSANTFVVDIKRGKRRIIKGDRPEWGGWKLQ